MGYRQPRGSAGASATAGNRAWADYPGGYQGKSMIVRPCTRMDFEAFYSKGPPMTLRALAAERDGDIVGIGGYYIVNGMAHAFTDQRGMTRREMVKAARQLVAFLDTVKTQMIAQCGSDGDTALKHYGYEPWGDHLYRRAEWGTCSILQHRNSARLLLLL